MRYDTWDLPLFCVRTLLMDLGSPIFSVIIPWFRVPLGYLLFFSLLSCTRNVGTPRFHFPGSAIYTLTLQGPEVTPPASAVLFVGARGTPDSPPSFVRRLPFIPFPLTVSLRSEDAMVPGLAVTTAPLYLFARLDRDGDPSTVDPEDLLGETEVPYSPGSTGVIIELRSQRERFEAFRFRIRMIGSSPLPSTGSGFVLLIDPRTASVIAGERFPIPSRLPYELELGPASLFRPPPHGSVEVYLKLDDDGDPASPGLKDLRGSGVTEGSTITITLHP